MTDSVSEVGIPSWFYCLFEWGWFTTAIPLSLWVRLVCYRGFIFSSSKFGLLLWFHIMFSIWCLNHSGLDELMTIDKALPNQGKKVLPDDVFLLWWPRCCLMSRCCWIHPCNIDFSTRGDLSLMGSCLLLVHVSSTLLPVEFFPTVGWRHTQLVDLLDVVSKLSSWSPSLISCLILVQCLVVHLIIATLERVLIYLSLTFALNIHHSRVCLQELLARCLFRQSQWLYSSPLLVSLSIFGYVPSYSRPCLPFSLNLFVLMTCYFLCCFWGSVWYYACGCWPYALVMTDSYPSRKNWPKSWMSWSKRRGGIVHCVSMILLHFTIRWLRSRRLSSSRKQDTLSWEKAGSRCILH